MTFSDYVKMTHQEVMTLSKEEKISYREAMNLDFHNKVKTAIDNGYTHIQIGFSGCIKVKKNRNGIFYIKRHGKGKGSDLGQYADLRDCTKSLMHNGWGNNITYK